MPTRYTEVDFERLSWHDCHIWRLDFLAGDSDEGDWTSDLLLGVDFIVEWLCGVDGSTKFKIAPATLAFHGVDRPKNRDLLGVRVAFESRFIQCRSARLCVSS